MSDKGEKFFLYLFALLIILCVIALISLAYRDNKCEDRGGEYYRHIGCVEKGSIKRI